MMPQHVRLTFFRHQLKEFYLPLGVTPQGKEGWKHMAAQALAFYTQGTGGVVRAENAPPRQPPNVLDANNAWEHLANAALRLWYPAAWQTRTFVELHPQHIRFVHACHGAQTP